MAATNNEYADDIAFVKVGINARILAMPLISGLYVEFRTY